MEKSFENRDNLLMTITGDGKGKTTSAIGMALRCTGWGGKAIIIQFVKGMMKTGEREAIASVKNLEILPLGIGMPKNFNNPDTEHEVVAQSAWDKTVEILSGSGYNMVVLDELNIALNYRWLDTSEVVRVLSQYKEKMHIVVTGRYAPEELVEASDLVSSIDVIKHPFQKGINAQKGVDY